VAGASDTLDPIAAAEAGIAGSKHLIASVANDLSQQERWLAHYRVAEQRRARRAKVREMIYWLELRRRRLARWLRRVALIGLRLARNAAAFLWRNAVALGVIVRDTATAGFLWLRPRVYAAALMLAAWTLALLAWAATEIRLLARAAGKAAAIAAAWIAQQAQILGAILWRWLIVAWAWTRIEAARLARASIKAASIGAAWSAAQARALATSLRRETVRLASWTNKKAGHFSRASLATASLGFSWTKQAGQRADASHRALVIRRCTALISFEPRRAHLPALNGPDAPHPVSSRAVHASP
jgi:hypothetical protein